MTRVQDFFSKWLFPILLATFGLYAAWHLVIWLANPWQNEFREGIVLPIADCFLKGGSPYDGHTSINLGYVYGFLPSLLVAAIQRLLGVGSRMLENRLLSVGSILATAGLIECAARRLSQGKAPRFLAFALMIPAGWIMCEVDARADHLAMLLSVLAVFVLLKQITWQRILLSSACTILAFYSKQYLILVGFPIFLYLLTVDVKKAFGYGFISAALLVGSMILVNDIFPLYFTMAIFCTGAIDSSLVYTLVQTAIFGWFYWPLGLVILLGLFATRHERLEFGKHSPSRLAALATLSSAFFLTARLGGNGGALLSYYSQLLLPWMLLWAAALLPKVQFNRFLVVLIVGGTAIFSLWHFGPYRTEQSVDPTKIFGFRFGAFAFTPPLSEKEHAEWKRLQSQLKPLPPDKIMTDSPACCSLAFEHGMTHYEAGHGFEWCVSNVCECPSAVARALPWMTRGAQEAYAQCKEFRANEYADIVNGKFEAILTDASADGLRANLSHHYMEIDRFRLRTGYQVNTLVLLVRKRQD